MSIIFNGVSFSEPESLAFWTPPFKAGLYAILIPSPNISPKPFEVIYFGESGNMSERGFASHHRRACWLRQAGNEANLYIAVYLMPNSSEQERKQIEAALIAKYNPQCNRT
jgi:hypothetical protein